MSADPKAFIYYGIQLGECPKFDGNDEHDVNEDWAQLHMPPTPGNENYRSREWDDWRENVAKGYGSSLAKIEIAWSGAENNTCYFVHCQILKKSVEWDEQIELVPTDFIQNRPEADEWLRKFCEKYGIPYSQPKWMLASRYF